jgi:hypothetical protein
MVPQRAHGSFFFPNSVLNLLVNHHDEVVIPDPQSLAFRVRQIDQHGEVTLHFFRKLLLDLTDNPRLFGHVSFQ